MSSGNHTAGWISPALNIEVDDTESALAHEAYRFFRIGHRNTRQIALLMKTNEAEAERLVTIGRCAYRGLKSPYRGRK